MILFFAFFAGVLSVLAPCVLPVLPVLLWGGIAKQNSKSPYIILISSLFFIFVFTLVLKIWASFLPISQETFTIISAIIITSYGLILIWPQLRDRAKSLLPSRSSHLNSKNKKTWFRGDVLLWASLGPIFASCSPTYALIISTILPANLTMGILSILMYIIGFWLVIFIIIYFGKEALQHLRRYANPEGIFKKIIGIILILTGVLILSWGFKQIESQIVNTSFWTFFTKIEKNAVKKLN